MKGEKEASRERRLTYYGFKLGARCSEWKRDCERGSCFKLGARCSECSEWEREGERERAVLSSVRGAVSGRERVRESGFKLGARCSDAE